MDWAECHQSDSPGVTSSGADRGQLVWPFSPRADPSEWPQSASCDQPRLWQDPTQKQQYGSDQTDDTVTSLNATSPQRFAAQVSSAEYEKQKKEYTASAVADLIHSPEYQRRSTMCQLCWCSWYLGEIGSDCPECGGYALSRPCPVCQGRCDSIWHRDVDMSHSAHCAHWDGACHLPEDEKANFLLLALMGDASEDDIVDDMSDLTTS